jgi:effector-binding domain-containing protein
VPLSPDDRESAEAVVDVEVDELPTVDRALTTVHLGAMDSIGQTWQALARAVEAQGLRAVGKCREVYLETPPDDQDSWVTELQQPVA